MSSASTTTIIPANSFGMQYQNLLNKVQCVDPISKGFNIPDIKHFHAVGASIEECSSETALIGERVLAITVPSVENLIFARILYPELMNLKQKINALGIQSLALISKENFTEMSRWQMVPDTDKNMHLIADPGLSLITKLGIVQNTKYHGLCAKFGLIYIKNLVVDLVAVADDKEISSKESSKEFIDSFLEKINLAQILSNPANGFSHLSQPRPHKRNLSSLKRTETMKDFANNTEKSRETPKKPEKNVRLKVEREFSNAPPTSSLSSNAFLFCPTPEEEDNENDNESGASTPKIDEYLLYNNSSENSSSKPQEKKEKE